MQQLIQYKDELTDSELDFLVHKEEKESRNFFKVISMFMIICFVIPFIVAWFRVLEDEYGVKNPFSFTDYFLGVTYLLAFLGFCAWMAYRKTLQKIKTDIRRKSKTIERTRITRKQYMASNHTYYFYLDSPNKLSIEVTDSDYHVFNEGDEVNIEYSTNAKLYFGYF